MPEFSMLASLTRGFDHVVRDPIWGDIHFPESFTAILSSGVFSLMDGIRQLGPVALVYPGATHTRKAHSMGVYFLARKLLISLIERGQIPSTSDESLLSFLVAALCHDIGHFPFAHSLKELPLARHEILAGELVIQEPLRSIIGECGADPEQVASIIDGDREDADDKETSLLRTFLSGVLDPDKIDYLTRDAFYCGVPYGIQDADFILRRVLTWQNKLGIDTRGEMSVEAILFSKYQMYRSVYWHPFVRAATSMVRKAIQMALDDAVLVPENLYGLDDAGLRSLAQTSGYAPLKLASDAFKGDVFVKVAEMPFNERNAAHLDLGDLHRREEAEAALAMASKIADTDVVIDIPEPINLETNLPVRTSEGWQPFSERTKLFGAETLSEITRQLRQIRVFVRKERFDPAIEALAGALLS
jgi:HD superfamily phosphohydrolase